MSKRMRTSGAIIAMSMGLMVAAAPAAQATSVIHRDAVISAVPNQSATRQLPYEPRRAPKSPNSSQSRDLNATAAAIPPFAIRLIVRAGLEAVKRASARM